MYMNDSKQFAKNEKEQEILILEVRIYSYDVGIEFTIEKCAMQIMKSKKRQLTEKIEMTNQEKSEHSKQWKQTNTWEYWKQTPSNM